MFPLAIALLVLAVIALELIAKWESDPEPLTTRKRLGIDDTRDDWCDWRWEDR